MTLPVMSIWCASQRATEPTSRFNMYEAAAAAGGSEGVREKYGLSGCEMSIRDVSFFPKMVQRNLFSEIET